MKRFVCFSFEEHKFHRFGTEENQWNCWCKWNCCWRYYKTFHYKYSSFWRLIENNISLLIIIWSTSPLMWTADENTWFHARATRNCFPGALAGLFPCPSPAHYQLNQHTRERSLLVKRRTCHIHPDALMKRNVNLICLVRPPFLTWVTGSVWYEGADRNWRLTSEEDETYGRKFAFAFI